MPHHSPTAIILTALLALGGCGGDAAKEKLVIEAGAAKRDVTPSFEPFTDENGNHVHDDGEPFEDADGDAEIDTLYVGGFGVRQPTGVHDSLWARTAALSLSGTVYTFTSVDSLGLSLMRADNIKKAAVEALAGIAKIMPERIIVASTHTHQGPDTVGIFGPEGSEGSWDADYLALVETRAVESIVDAVHSLEPAKLIVTHAEADEGFVRDINEPDIRDPYVGVIQALKEDGSAAIATLASIANHPEAAWADNTLISSDYPHFMREKIEQRFGGIAIHFSGALGLMQTPAEVAPEGFERARMIGETYAEKISAAISAAEPLSPPDLSPRFASVKITAPLENGELWLGIKTGIIDGYKDYLYDCELGDFTELGCLDVPAAALRLGDRLTIVTIPGEIVPELIVGGIRKPDDYQGYYPDAPAEPALKDHLATPERFIMGLADAECGYLFPMMTFDPENNFSQHHGPGPRAASYFMAGLVKMMDGLNR